jgi:anti-anti-sigma factor
MDKKLPVSEFEKRILDIDIHSIFKADLRINTAMVDAETLRVSIEGKELDFSEGSTVLSALCKYLKHIPTHLILELKACPYISSLGVGGLAHLALDLQADHHKICIVGVHESFRELLATTNLNQIISVFKSTEDAIGYLSSDAMARENLRASS